MITEEVLKYTLTGLLIAPILFVGASLIWPPLFGLWIFAPWFLAGAIILAISLLEPY